VNARSLIGGGPTRAPLLVALAVAIVVLGVSGCGGGSDATPGPSASRAVAPSTAPASASADQRMPPRSADLAPGRVRIEPGPFTDRVVIRSLRVEPGARPLVRGRIRNSVDVSELIVLELRADFYDRTGRLVGSGVRVFEDLHAGAGEPFAAFTISPDGRAPTAVSAILTIPQLANE
jgi:hypothetical protein